MEDSIKKRSKSAILRHELIPQKRKLSDYEPQELKKKKAKFFPKNFLQQISFVREKSNKRLYSLMKVSKTGISEDPSEYRRKIMRFRKLKHPNLINLHHFFEDEQYFYLILDEICGGNLSLLFYSQKKRYYEKDAFLIFYQICLGVEYLHRKKLIHGKINLGNLYYSSEQLLKINYFWLDEYAINSYENQSPELIKSKSPHVSTDIWNIALILYEITHGLHPFRGVTNYETCKKILKEENIVFAAHVSDDLVELLRGMFEKKSEFRWYFKEILQCDWFKKYQTYHGFDIKIDLNAFNTPCKNENLDNDSDESVQFKKQDLCRRKSETENHSAFLKIQRVNTKYLVGNEEEKVSEMSVESAFSAFLIKSNYSSPTSSPFVIKPRKIESDEQNENGYFRKIFKKFAQTCNCSFWKND